MAGKFDNWRSPRRVGDYRVCSVIDDGLMFFESGPPIPHLTDPLWCHRMDDSGCPTYRGR